MDQYFSGRTHIRTSYLCESDPTLIENKVFSNERVDDKWKKSHLRINNSTFAKMGFKGSVFTQCDLKFCTFIDCYFRQAMFTLVDFTSCVFINCSFDKAEFNGCDFKYASFTNCFIPYSEMKKNLPVWGNVCSELCRNLSLQCLALGSVQNYRDYLFEERASDEKHAFRKLFHSSSDPHYQSYNFLDGLTGLLTFIRSRLSRFIWGYGEQICAVIRSMLLVIFLFACIFYICRDQIIFEGCSYTAFLSAFYLSACNFFSFVGSGVFQTAPLQLLGLSEYILGVILIGFLVAALFRQINKR